MMLIEKTAVPDAALPVDAFRAHLRLGSDFTTQAVEDDLLQSFLRAALAAVEARTGRMLLVRDFSWSLTRWRDPAAQALPVAPVAAVARVALVARDGTETEVAPERYWLERDAQRPVLRAVGAALPQVPPGGSVQIDLEAGQAVAWTDLPADLRQAVLMLAAHYYEYREDTGLSAGCMPFGVSSLIERYRTVRMGLGLAR